MKTSAKYFHLALWPWARQHEPKWPTNYLWRHSQKSTTPTK